MSELGRDSDIIATHFQGPVTTHGPALCVGEYCCIHNPSPHHMVEWPLQFRLDRRDSLAERICEHGIGHPDPDAVAYIHGRLAEVGAPKSHMLDVVLHGCCGCCGAPPTEAPTEIHA